LAANGRSPFELAVPVFWRYASNELLQSNGVDVVLAWAIPTISLPSRTSMLAVLPTPNFLRECLGDPQDFHNPNRSGRLTDWLVSSILVVLHRRERCILSAGHESKERCHGKSKRLSCGVRTEQHDYRSYRNESEQLARRWDRAALLVEKWPAGYHVMTNQTPSASCSLGDCASRNGQAAEMSTPRK
jgi:hypothetical protein